MYGIRVLFWSATSIRWSFRTQDRVTCVEGGASGSKALPKPSPWTWLLGSRREVGKSWTLLMRYPALCTGSWYGMPSMEIYFLSPSAYIQFSRLDGSIPRVIQSVLYKGWLSSGGLKLVSPAHSEASWKIAPDKEFSLSTVQICKRDYVPHPCDRIPGCSSSWYIPSTISIDVLHSRPCNVDS